MTPAEERAERDGLPVVLMIPFELMRVAAGNPMITRTASGDEVLVRIPTPSELLAASRDAGNRLAAIGAGPWATCAVPCLAVSRRNFEPSTAMRGPRAWR